MEYITIIMADVVVVICDKVKCAQNLFKSVKKEITVDKNYFLDDGVVSVHIIVVTLLFTGTQLFHVDFAFYSTSVV